MTVQSEPQEETSKTTPVISKKDSNETEENSEIKKEKLVPKTPSKKKTTPKSKTPNGAMDKEGFRKGIKLTSVPRTGKVNVIELRQAKRTDFLFTRLEEEQALKYSIGRAPAKYAFTDGQLCIIITKYRGDAIDANNQKVGECYTLLFTDHYAMINADLEDIVEDITDDEIKEQVFVLDESKSLRFKNKWLVERERRIRAEEFKKMTREEIRLEVTQGVADIIDDLTLVANATRHQMDSFDRTSVEKWIKKNWMFLMIGALAVMVFSTMF